MIVLIARASAERPVMTTPESIQLKGEYLSELMAGVVNGLLNRLGEKAGVAQPSAITIHVEWADGTESATPLDIPFPGGKVPPHMS